MKKYLILALIVFSVSSVAQQKHRSKGGKVQADALCVTIREDNCYNIYGSQDQFWIGVYSLTDKNQTVTLLESFDCTKTKDVGPSGNPVYVSKKVDKLRISCAKPLVYQSGIIK